MNSSDIARHVTFWIGVHLQQQVVLGTRLPIPDPYSFGGGRVRDNILSYVWDQIWQKLDKIALSNKKPVLTTSSNQLTNKDINGYGIS